MVDYLYDGTFEGLLTCIYHNYYSEPAAGIYEKDRYQFSMLSRCCEICCDEKKAGRVYRAIREKISDDDLKRIYKIFASSSEKRENIILEYIKLGFIKGHSVSLMHGDPAVFAAQSAEQKVNAEIHRFKGLLRFSALANQVLYSRVEPDSDILEFLAPHFCSRFSGEAFMIHDVSRSKALISSSGCWYISDFFQKEVPLLAENEKDFRSLWKNYFDTAAISQRTNPRCQKRFMPVRYWKHLTEMQTGSGVL